DDAPARLKEIAELRASIGRAGSDLVARRLLASLGAELGAPMIVAVSMDNGRPIARVIRAPATAFDRIELGATVETSQEGARSFRWPGAAATLHGLLPGAPVAPSKPLPTAP